MRKLAVWTRFLRRFIGRPWYLPSIAFLAAADLYIAVVPTDALLISYVLVRPKSWIPAFLWVGLGSAIGSFSVGALIHYGGGDFLQSWFPGLFHSSAWESTRTFVHNHGGLALGLISASVFPQQPAVIIAALSGMPLAEIFWAIFIGRLTKYSLFSWVASHAPGLLARFSVGRKAVALSKVSPSRSAESRPSRALP